MAKTEPQNEAVDAVAGTTVKQVADACGVSKSTAVRHLKRLKDELGVDTATSAEDGRGTEILPPSLASALADSLTKGGERVPEPHPTEGLYQFKARDLEQQVKSLEREVERLHIQLEQKDAAALEVGEATQAQIDQLKAENERLRADLALSRRLEGFHWPWVRDRIKAQHLLPQGSTEK